MMMDTVLQNISRNEGNLERLQSQMTSGKRLTRPSDDPQGVHLTLAYRTDRDAANQHLRNIEHSMAWVQASETQIDSAVDAIHRARELGIMAANDALGPDQRSAIATELDELVNHLVTLGNATLRGQHLFAGTQIDTNPLLLTSGPPTTVTYQGDSGQMLREIDTGVTIPINTSGAFLPGVIAGVISLRDHAVAGDVTGMQADLNTLDGGMDQLLDAQAQIGATTARLESTRDQLSLTQIHTLDQISKIEDVDFTEAATEFAIQETVYKAALAAASKAIQPSLLDYLR